MKNIETELKAAVCLIYGHRDILSERNKHRLLTASGANKLLQCLADLLTCVDERCGGKAEGNSELVKACDKARSELAKWEAAA